MKCVKCNLDLPESAMFCPNCGNSSRNLQSSSFSPMLLIKQWKDNFQKTLSTLIERRQKSIQQKELQLKTLHPEFFNLQTGRIVEVEHERSSVSGNSFIYTIEVESKNKPKLFFYDSREKQRFTEGSKVKFKLNRDYTIDELELLL